MSFRLSQTRVTWLLIICLILSLFMVTEVGAVTDLNGIGGTQQDVTNQPVSQPQQDVPYSPTEGGSSAEAVKSLFDEVGVDEHSSQEAKRITQPLVYYANLGFAILLSFALIVMFFITGLDIVYIAVPPLRRFLLSEQPQQSGGFNSGFGAGFGGMSQPSSSSSKLGQLISDEAKAAVAESQPQQSGGFGAGFGGGFGGGFGAGFAGEPAKPKSLIISYMKKRIVFFITFGICAVLLSTTLFTDIGISLGTWIMNRLIGINNSIPE